MGPMDYSMPGSFVLSYLLEFKFISIELVILSNHLTLCCPLLILLPMKVFSNDSALHIRWPKYWNFSISPSSEYSVLISFRIDCLDLLVVQGTLKSLFQHHSLKVPILWDSAFFMDVLLRINSFPMLPLRIEHILLRINPNSEVKLYYNTKFE